MKKHTYIFVALITLLLIFLKFEYDMYNKKLNLYKSNFWLDLERAHVAFVKNQKKTIFEKKQFEQFLKSDKITNDYISWLNEIKYNIIFRGDSIFLYCYGFDNKDDSLKSRYLVKNLSFFKAFFIKGDILLYKNLIDIDTSLDKKNYHRINNNSLKPQPPRPIPKKILDSLKNIDSISRTNFINNYK